MKKRPRTPMICPDTAMGVVGLDLIQSDVQGSYSGVPEEPYDLPVQDADDL